MSKDENDAKFNNCALLDQQMTNFALYISNFLAVPKMKWGPQDLGGSQCGHIQRKETNKEKKCLT
jgi:hypothetical protein